MKKHLASGLIILLPAVLTILIVSFLVNIFTQPFIKSTQIFLSHFSFFQRPFLFLSQKTLLVISSKILILVFLFFFVVLIGLIGKLFLVEALLKMGNYILHKLPIVNKVYKACQEVVESLLSSSSKKFSEVVLVPFPRPGNLSIGLVTGDKKMIDKEGNKNESFVSVFVPGTPNPSVGFMLMFERSQLIHVDMTVEEAMKFVVSCGIVMPNFEIITHEKLNEIKYTASDILPSEG